MRETKLVFASACFGILLFGICLISLGSVASALQNKFQLDQISSGALFSILPIGILAGSLVFGPFADRYGYKIILLVSCFCMVAGFQGIAFATSLNVLRVCIFLFGLGGGAINGASNAVVSDISKTNKGANLSLLGVFFSIGALGMPFVLGALEKVFSFSQLVSAVGMLPVAASILFAMTPFPKPKQAAGVAMAKVLQLLTSRMIVLVGFFLACQSSFEGIINNWTTTYLGETLSIPNSNALFALSLYVMGMAVMRIVIGGVFRNIPIPLILTISFTLLASGCVVLRTSDEYAMSVTGLILLGAGLAAGFPVMLGIIGSRYAEVSGTAFSIVLTMALLGNMTVNVAMGIVAETYGIKHLTTVALVLLGFMVILSVLINKRESKTYT